MALQPGWEAAVDAATGATYYFHRARGESQWNRPTPLSEGRDISEDDRPEWSRQFVAGFRQDLGQCRRQDSTPSTGSGSEASNDSLPEDDRTDILPGWGQYQTSDGRTYWFHRASRQTRWERPTLSSLAPALLSRGQQQQTSASAPVGPAVPQLQPGRPIEQLAVPRIVNEVPADMFVAAPTPQEMRLQEMLRERELQQQRQQQWQQQVHQHVEAQRQQLQAKQQELQERELRQHEIVQQHQQQRDHERQMQLQQQQQQLQQQAQQQARQSLSLPPPLPSFHHPTQQQHQPQPVAQQPPPPPCAEATEAHDLDIRALRRLRRQRQRSRTSSFWSMSNDDEEEEECRSSYSNARLSCGLTRAQLADVLFRDITTEDYEMLLSLDEAVPKRTLSQAAVEGMRLASYKECHNESCTICLSSFSPSDKVVKLPCRHVFHKDCISRWLLERSRHCPVCGKQAVGGF
eukprot:TRINITY_DN1058_c2_g1_i1.p1 TRINITY_DN1058_c2_g1~~TRINITY_DN1058_c2_g1_i1.p1  ORF type:complete len:461 (+),score=107.49 TRINITY_DN1058_c2_g1_i1:151-1533(+)